MIVTEPWEIEFGTQIVKSLDNSEFEFTFMVADHYSTLYQDKFVKSTLGGFPYTTIEKLHKKWQTRHHIFQDDDTEFLRLWEKDNCKTRSMLELIATHQGLNGWENSRYYYKLKEREKNEIAADLIKSFESEMKNNQIEIVISLSRRSFISNIAFEYCLSKEIPTHTLIQTRVNHRWMFRNDFGFGTSPEYVNQICNTSIGEEAHRFKTELESRNSLYVSLTHGLIGDIKKSLESPVRSFIQKLRITARRSVSRFLYDKKSRKYKTNKLGENLLLLSLTEFRNLFYYFLLIANYKRMFSSEPLQSESVAWFLHARPEDSTLVLGRGKDELEQIAQISKLVKSGELIYVKENALMFGVRDINFYKKIKSLKNVRLLSPTYDNETLLENVNRVVGVSGTVLLEAKLKGLRVYSMGEPEFIGILDNHRYSTLESFIRQADSTQSRIENLEWRYVQWVINNSAEFHVPFLADLTCEKSRLTISDLAARLGLLLTSAGDET